MAENGGCLRVWGFHKVDEHLSRIRIVLVEPSHPGNIGGAARALKTMGLRHLGVVNPRRFPDPQAEWRAAGAQDVLEATEIYASVDEAIADCHWVVGTSTRSRRIPWPVLSAEQAAAQAKDEPGGIAILFGRESSGLTNDELQKCHCHVQIPASSDYPSLNLAMAVQVVCYELFKRFSSGTPGAAGWDRPAASMAELQELLQHLETVLLASAFLDPDNRGQTMTRLRRLFSRLRPDRTEVQMLRGILTHLDPRRSPPDNSGSN
jgi:tRNA (cytidine32/uridine32-2'-O)-methyltransferase